MLVNAVTATVASFGGGFGEATIKFVGQYRGREDKTGLGRIIIASLAISAGLGMVLSLVLVLAAPLLVARVFRVPHELLSTLVTALRLGAIVLLFRMVEAVFTAVLRGCERYGPPVAIGAVSRFLTITIAVVLALRGSGLVPILTATLFVALVSLSGQALAVVRIVDLTPWRMSLSRDAVYEVWSLGIFTWAKSIAGVLFSYGDRLIVGAFLGMEPLAYYSICAQMTQPIAASIASAFHFVFPRMSVALGSGNTREALKVYRNAMRFSAAAAVMFSAPLMIFASPLLTYWIGLEVAKVASTPLILMALANGLLAVCAVPQYASLALGKARALAILTAGIGLLSLGSCVLLIHSSGLVGVATSRLFAGALSLGLFSIVRGAFREAEQRPETVQPFQSFPSNV